MISILINIYLSANLWWRDSTFSNDDIYYHNILSLLHSYNMDIQALQNHPRRRDLQLFYKMLDCYILNIIFQDLILEGNCYLVLDF
jgi:hypothetical protein